MADNKFSKILSASSIDWRGLPIDTRDPITVSQAQFAENGIGLYAGNGYPGVELLKVAS
jgi:hypothetical protein